MCLVFLWISRLSFHSEGRRTCSLFYVHVVWAKVPWMKYIWLIRILLIFFIYIKDHEGRGGKNLITIHEFIVLNAEEKKRHILLLFSPSWFVNFICSWVDFPQLSLFTLESSCLIAFHHRQTQHTCCSAAVRVLQSSLIGAQFALFTGVPQGQNLRRQNARAIFAAKPDVWFHPLGGWHGPAEGERRDLCLLLKPDTEFVLH